MTGAGGALWAPVGSALTSRPRTRSAEVGLCSGFFLIQSLYFLVADVAPRGQDTEVDPFDRAHARAESLLGDRG